MQLFLFILVSVYTLFQLWLISLQRKISWRTAFLYLWVGAFTVTTACLFVHLLTTNIIPPKINSYTINPIVEEVLTILPIFVLAWKTSLGEELSILDWMILGAAMGCGFGLMETGVRIVGTAQTWRMPQVTWSNVDSLLVTWLPERVQYSINRYAGHGITGAFMGLGVGIWRKHRSWGWVPLLITVTWACLDHMLNNYTINLGPWKKSFARSFWELTGRGKDLPWVLTLGVISVVIMDVIGRWREWRNTFVLYAKKLRRFVPKNVRSFIINMYKLPRVYAHYLAHVHWINRSRWGKLYTIGVIYLWLSFILVFFLNGIFQRSFYRFYLSTPLWWLAGFVGTVFAVIAIRRWIIDLQKQRQMQPNEKLMLFGRGMLCGASVLYLGFYAIAVAVELSSYPVHKLMTIHFFYYAADTFTNFFRDGLASAIAVLNGIVGLVGISAAEASGYTTFKPGMELFGAIQVYYRDFYKKTVLRAEILRKIKEFAQNYPAGERIPAMVLINELDMRVVDVVDARESSLFDEATTPYPCTIIGETGFFYRAEQPK